MVARVNFKDNDANGDMSISVDKAPEGASVNAVAAYIYDRVNFYSGGEGVKYFGDPKGAIGECSIQVEETAAGFRFSIDYGEEGASDNFWPVSHQLGTLLLEDAVKKLNSGDSGAAAARSLCN